MASRSDGDKASHSVYGGAIGNPSGLRPRRLLAKRDEPANRRDADQIGHAPTSGVSDIGESVSTARVTAR